VKYREGWAAYKFKAIFGDWPTADDRVPTEIEKPPRPELVSWIMGDKAKHAARLRRRNVVDIRQVAVKLGGEASGPNSVLIPGPGHSPRDRSLSVRFDARVRGGFSVYSQCGDELEGV
jgi:hypothetical protein